MPDDQKGLTQVRGPGCCRRIAVQSPHVGWVTRHVRRLRRGTAPRRYSILVDEISDPPRLDTSAHPEIETQRGSQIVAGAMRVVRHHPGDTVAVGLDDRGRDIAEHGAAVRDHQMPARPQYPDE